RFGQGVFHGGLPYRDLDQAASPQREHSLLDRLLLQFVGRSANENQLAQFIIDLHDFVETGATLVSAFVASGTAFAVIDLGGLRFFGRVAGVDKRLVGNFQLFLAVRTNSAHEALGANQVH